jgi:hypothetical protein
MEIFLGIFNHLFRIAVFFDVAIEWGEVIPTLHTCAYARYECHDIAQLDTVVYFQLSKIGETGESRRFCYELALPLFQQSC